MHACRGLRGKGWIGSICGWDCSVVHSLYYILLNVGRIVDYDTQRKNLATQTTRPGKRGDH